MRVWVTGAAGFVGRHLLARLEQEGCTAIGCDLEVDVTRGDAVQAALGEAAPDAVVHLAALTFVPDSVADPFAAFRVNYTGTFNVLEATRRLAPKARVLVVTTAHVYGAQQPGDPPFTEAAPLAPDSPYARAKAAADLLAVDYASRGLDVVRARPFNHTGPGRPDRFAESSFARQLVEMALGRREPRLEVGNLDAVRDFLHVADVVEAYWRLLQPGPEGAFNVASGRGVTLHEVLRQLCTLTGQSPTVEVRQDRWRPADATVGDASALMRATGWAPRYDLEATLAELVDDWRERLR